MFWIIVVLAVSSLLRVVFVLNRRARLSKLPVHVKWDEMSKDDAHEWLCRLHGVTVNGTLINRKLQDIGAPRAWHDKLPYAPQIRPIQEAPTGHRITVDHPEGTVSAVIWS